MSSLGSSAMKGILVYAIRCQWQEASSVSKHLKTQCKIFVISFLTVLLDLLYSIFNELCVYL